MVASRKRYVQSATWRWCRLEARPMLKPCEQSSGPASPPAAARGPGTGLEEAAPPLLKWLLGEMMCSATAYHTRTRPLVTSRLLSAGMAGENAAGRQGKGSAGK